MAPGHVDLSRLPPVTMTVLMERFDEWVCDPRMTRTGVKTLIGDPARVGEQYLGQYLVRTTSGTPLRLVRDLVRVARRGGRVATLLVAGGHHGGAVMVAWAHRRHPRLAHRSRLLSVLRPLPELVEELHGSALHGYPPALALLAIEQDVGRVRIDRAPIGGTGETLTPTTRVQIESAFGCRVRDTSGSSEPGGIAFECDQRQLHVNTDWVVEPVDEDHEPVPAGVPSHTILVTNLANRVQPVIRYDLGDSVTWHTSPCRCGSPLPTIAVRGRSDGTITLAGRNGDVQILPLAVTTVAEDTDGVRRIQLVQTGRDSLAIRVETTASADATQVWGALHRRLTAHLARQGAAAVHVTRSRDAPTVDASGNNRAVVTRRAS